MQRPLMRQARKDVFWKLNVLACNLECYRHARSGNNRKNPTHHQINQVSDLATFSHPRSVSKNSL